MWLERIIVNTNLYEFFYNILIWFINLFPSAGIGLGVIALTLFVKIILIPLTYRSIRHQIQQKKIEPLLQEIRKKYADDQKKQSQEILALYKEHKTNPFAGCFLVLIQIVVIVPLYYVFLNLEIMPDRLYGFVDVPETLRTMFLGVDLTSRNVIFALLAGLSQFGQMYFSPAMKAVKPKDDTGASSQAQMMQSMQKSMKFTMPIMITVFAYVTPAAVALYWTVSNLFTIGQELVIRKRLQKKEEPEVVVVDSSS